MSCFLLAGRADEAAGVVGLAQGRHHLPFDEVLAAEAAGPVQPLVVQSADVVPLTHEEASLGQLGSTYCDKRRNGEGKGGRAMEGAGKQGQKQKDNKRLEKSDDIRSRKVQDTYFYCAKCRSKDGLLLTWATPNTLVIPRQSSLP